MCGFGGYYSPNRQPVAVAEHMAAILHHRGPDDAGVWQDDANGLVLVHRRLAILDLSPAGHQPMHSASGRYVLVFNGEIYNHLELRQKLSLPAWRGSSDTETLLACIEQWGIEPSLQCSTGMFAIALWDRQQRILTLARDRMGEKPLYYGWQHNTFLFGSELKALKAHPDFAGEVNRDALALLLRHNDIPAPFSIYQGIWKLPAGTYLSLQPDQPGQARQQQPVAYWSLRDVVQVTRQNPFTGTDRQAVDVLEHTLSDAIQRQQLADVPLGAFLSGGVDSSIVVALMQATSARPVNTFTIGLSSDQYNEAGHAKTVAEHLGTQHTELYVSAEDALGVIPHLPTLYDEPFADASQIPTYLVTRLASQHVTVALSGDGGDELFAGYNRYMWVQRIWSRIGWLPMPLRRQITQLLTLLPVHQWDRLNRLTQAIQPKRLHSVQLGDKLYKLAARIGNIHSLDELYYRLVSTWQDPEPVVHHSREPRTLLTSPAEWPDLPDSRERMMYLDSMTYLPDDILTKVDRAAMGNSLETRVPLLDHHVVELAWRLPLHLKIRHGQSKWVLRQVLYRHVPEKLINRPKMGFAIPLDDWLRGPLRDWAEHLLDEQRLQQQGFFNPAPIRQRWQQHLAQSCNGAYSLWSVLMFQAWLEQH